MSETKKKILLFMPLIGGGGVERNLFNVANFLSTKFKKIYICSSSITNRPKLHKNIVFINKNKNSLKSLAFIYLRSIIVLIKFLLKNKKVTIISFQANIYCIIISKLLGSRIIVRSNASPSGWVNNFFKKKFFQFILHRSDKLIVNSRNFKAEMKKTFNIKSELIFNPLNQKEIRFLSKLKTNIKFFDNYKYLKILNIGRLTLQKDHMTLLKSLKYIKRKINFRLLIIGSGLECPKLKNYIKENHLSNNVKIIKYQKNPFGVFRKADLFILSSKYEGSPNVLLEAATLKKFIISSDCPTGPSEILAKGKYGLLFKVGDYKGLAKNILKFHSMKVDKKKIITNKLYNTLINYDFQKNLNKYLKLINDANN